MCKFIKGGDARPVYVSYGARLRSTSNHAHICKCPEQSPCGAPVPDTNICGTDFQNAPLNCAYRYIDRTGCSPNAGRIVGKLLVNGLDSDNAWYPQVVIW